MLTGPEGWLVVVSLIWLVPGGDSGGRAGVRGYGTGCGTAGWLAVLGDSAGVLR